MGIFGKLALRRRVRNCRKSVTRGLLKCLLPCRGQRSRSPSAERSKRNETSSNESVECVRIPPEIIEVDNTKETDESPHRVQIENTEEDHQREARALCLKDFYIMETLGEGAFGEVVRAKKKPTCALTLSDEFFALKLVPKECVNEVEEEVLVQAFGHPFLVQLHASFWTVESFCYVMEFAEGGTLLSLILWHGKLPTDLARFYAAEIVLAVDFLHTHGIIHRDIKPPNVLLDRDGHCKLADFGVAAVGVFEGMTIQHNCGTPRYVAPEVVEGCPYGHEVDWYAVGIVMMDMMMGASGIPFDWSILTPEAKSITSEVR